MIISLVVIALTGATASAATETFSPSGDYVYYTVPAGVTGIVVDATGGAGGNGSWSPGIGGRAMALGAPGGTIQGHIPVTPGETLKIFVGRGGGSGSGMTPGSGGAGGDYTGGDGGVGILSNAGGGGGGATTITRVSDGAILLVAGGGGAGGADGINFDPKLDRFVGGNGGHGGANPGTGGGGGTANATGDGGGGGADINYMHGGKGGIGVGTTGSGGGGGGGRWAGSGGAAGSVVATIISIISQGGGGGGGGTNFIAGGSSFVSNGIDNQSAGSNGKLTIATANATSTSLAVESPGFDGPNNRGILFTANVAGAGTGGTVNFTAMFSNGQTNGQTRVLCAAAPVTNGVATCAPTLAAGGYSVTATFGGDLTSRPSTSNTVTKDISKWSQVVFIDPPTRVEGGSSVTLTVRIDGAFGSGKVSFTGGANCNGNLYSSNGAWYSTCTVATSTSSRVTEYVAAFVPAQTTDPRVRMAPSSASVFIETYRVRGSVVNTIVDGAATINLGQSVTFTACHKTAEGGGPYCAAERNPNFIAFNMLAQNGAADPCRQEWSAGWPGWNKYIYICTPQSPGLHIFNTTYFVAENPNRFCDVAIVNNTCPTGWYDPVGATTINVLGPPAKLGVKVATLTGANAAMQFEGMTASVELRDAANNVVTGVIPTDVLYSVVDRGTNQLDTDIGRCRGDVCVSYVTDTVRIKAHSPSRNLTGYLDVSVYGSSPAREVFIGGPSKIRTDANDNPPFTLKVDAPHPGYEVNWYVDGRRICGGSQTQDPRDDQNRFTASCVFSYIDAMPSVGMHELSAVYREIDQAASSAFMTFEVVGSAVILDTPTFGTAIAGEWFDFDVHGRDANGTDTGSLSRDDLLPHLDANTSCAPDRRQCYSTEAGQHTLTVRYYRDINVIAYGTVTVQPAAIATLAVTPPALPVPVGTVPDIDVAAEDRFNNVVSDAASKVTWKLDDVDCPESGCVPTTVGSHAITATHVTAAGATVTASTTFTTSHGAPGAVTFTDLPTSGRIAGTSFPYGLTGTDAFGNTLTPNFLLNNVTVTADTGEVCSLVNGAHCVLTHTGVRTLIATNALGEIIGTGTVEIVHEAHYGVRVTPSASTVTAGDTVTLSAEFIDRFGNGFDPIHPVFMTYTAAGATCAATAGTCAFTTAGPYTVHATAQTWDSQVRPIAPVTINVTPGAPQTYAISGIDANGYQAGAQAQFMLTATDAHNNTTPLSAAGMTATLDSGVCSTADSSGSVTISCIGYTTGAAHQLRVFGSGGSALITRSVRINAGDLHHLEISGDTALTSGVATSAYTVRSLDVFTNEIAVNDPNASVYLDGVVCPARVCAPKTATAPDAAVIRASLYDVERFASATVVAGAPAKYTVSTPEPSYAAGASFTPTVLSTDANDNATGAITDARFELVGPWSSGHCTGQSCTAVNAGLNTLRAYRGITLLASTTLQVTPGAQTSILITPGSITVDPGTSVAYSALTSDIYGNAGFDGTPVVTSSDADLVCANGACSATRAKTYTVNVLAGSVTGTAQLIVRRGPATSLTLAPEERTITAGGSAAFTASTSDDFGNVVDVTTAAGYTLTSLSENMTCSASSCTSTKAGDHTARAAMGDLRQTVTVHVQPAALASLRVTPTSSDFSVGAVVGFQAVGLDTHQNELGLQADVTFMMNGQGCPLELCTIPGVGTHMVTATKPGGIVGQTTVTTTAGPLDHIVVTPGAAFTAGSDTTFTVTGYDADGNSRGAIDTGVTITGSDVVTCVNRTCASEKAGTYTLTVAAQGTSTTTSLQVNAATVRDLELSTVASTHRANDAITLTALAYDRFHNFVADVSTLALYSTTAGICSANVCRITTAGTHAISASFSGGNGSLQVPVTSAAATKVALMVNAGTFVVGGSEAVATAVVKDAYDNPVSDASISFSSDSVLTGGPSVGAMLNVSPGMYEAVVRSGDVTGSYALRASVPDGADANRIATTSITQHAGRPATVAVALAPNTLVANGTSTSTAIATVVDALDNPVPGVSVIFTSPGSQTFGAVTSTTVGQYTSVVTSSTTAGTSSITATVTVPADVDAPAVSESVDLVQVSGAPTELAVVSAAPSLVANGQTSTTLTVTIEDANGNRVTGRTVTPTASGAAPLPTFGTVTDNGDGTYTVVATSSTKAGAYVLTITDSVLGALTDAAALTQLPGVATQAALVLAPSSIVADGSSNTTATVTVRDANENLVPDRDVALVTDGQASTPVASGSNGVYTSTLTSTQLAGVSTIHADITSQTGAAALVDLDAEATLTQTPGVATELTLTTGASQLVANGEDTTTLTALVEDVHGNGVPNHTVTFAATPAGQAPVIGAVTDHGDGRYTAVATSSTKPGSYDITASASSATPAIDADTVTITQVPGQPAVAALTLAPTSVVADGASTTTATVHVEDRDGNVVPGATVALSSSGGQTIGAVTDAGAGDYTSTITSSTVAGSSTIRAAVTVASAPNAPARVATAQLMQRPGGATKLGVQLAHTELVADGAARTTAIATLTDANGNVVADGAPVTFGVDLGATTGAVAIAADGTSSAPITAGLTVGAATVTARSGALVATAPLTLRIRTAAPGTTPISGAGPADIIPPALNPNPPVTNGTIPVTVTCPTGAIGGCTGTVSVTPGSGTPGSAAGPGGGPANGSGSFTLQPGQSTTVDVPLGTDLIERLTANGSTRITISVTVRDEVGNAKTVTVQRTATMSRYKGMPLASQRLVLKRDNAVFVKVVCPKTATKTCSGTLDLSAVVDKQFLKRGTWRKPYMGTRRFSLKTGTTQLIRVQVNGLARHLLTKRPTINVHVVARTRDSVSRTFTTRTRVRIALR